MPTRYFALPSFTAQQSSAENYVNFLQALFDALVTRTVISATTTAQPGSPAEEDAYIVPAGATGTQWGGGTHTNQLTVSINSFWYFFTPFEGWTYKVQDDDSFLYYTGSAWSRLQPVTVQSGVTASTTQTQAAATQLTSETCHVSVCANANDAVKLPAASKGWSVFLVNRGAQPLQVFPASGDSIDGAAVDASTTIATGKARLFRTIDATAWFSILGA